MKEWFRGEEDEDFFAELIELKQEDTIDKYYKSFIRADNLVKIPTSQAMIVFIYSLKPEIKHVKVHKPKTLNQALGLAKKN